MYVRKPSIVPSADTVPEDASPSPTIGAGLKKKYPFNRATTPNSLREHLRETLVKNMEGNDLTDTIQSIKDDEIRDTFDIDNENIETPPVQRRGFRYEEFIIGSKGCSNI